jgi:restriction endonuclease S subunit
MESTLVSSRSIWQTNRWDFEYFDPEYIKIIDKIKKSGWSVRALGEIILALTDGQHGYLVHLPEGIPLIRTTNVFENEIRLDDVRYIAPEVHAKLKRSNLKPGDVLLVTIGVTLGVAAVVDDSIKEANINQNLVKITPNSEVNSFYLSLFLNSSFGKIQTQRTASKSVVPIVNYPRLREMLVPLPPLSIQGHIVQIMQDAYAERQYNLDKAANIEASINKLVLQKLGINWSLIEDIKQFTVPIIKLIGARFDVQYQSPKANYALSLLKKSGYNVSTLGDLITQIHYGASVKNDYAVEGIPFIRVGNLKPNYIDTTDIVYFEESKRDTLGRAFVKTGDLLMSRSGSVGIVAVVPPEVDGFAFGSFQIKFRLRDDYANPFFVAYFLNSPLGNSQVEQQKTGSIQMNITIEGIKALKVPLPAIEIQDEIVKQADERFIEAKRLCAEAENLLIQAKARVERMILGEEDGA